MFKCFLDDFTKLEKRINKICKKLDKYGLEYSFKRFPNTIEKVKLYEVMQDGCGKSEVYKGQIIVDVANYDFTMQDLKLGEWIPIVVIEHNQLQDGKEIKNMLHILSENISINPKWLRCNSFCEHCSTKRKRNKTVILQDGEGNHKQVGSSCIKDFTGIDAMDIISLYSDIHDIVLDDLKISYSEFKHKPYSKYTNTFDLLACCIDEIAKNGYIKDITLTNARNNMTNISEYGGKKAKIVLDMYRNPSAYKDTSFNRDIARSLANEYCKSNNLIAYAYIAYQEEMARQEKDKIQAQQKAISQYVFDIGEKINVPLTYLKSVSFENNYNGYSTQMSYLHFFVDDNGNVYKWSTAKFLRKNEKSYKELDIGSKVMMKGTVKSHIEYNGEKQTVITRCKIEIL